MTAIRILHISDLHLAQHSHRHSALDRIGPVRGAVEKLLLEDLKNAILEGSVEDVKVAFKDLLEQQTIAELLRTIQHVDKSKVAAAVDDVLDRIVRQDGSFRELLTQTLKDFTSASSYNTGALDCLCNFVEEQETDLKAIIITGDLATTGFDFDLEKGRIFLEGSGIFDQSIAATPAAKMLLPGNHDRYIYTAKGFLFAPGGNHFEAKLKNHWSGPVRRYPGLTNGDDLSVVIIAADFSLQSKTDCTLPFLKLSRLAQGRVYPAILDALVSATKDAKKEERSKGYTPVILWAVHFPPFFVHRNSSRVSRVLYNLTKNLIDEKLLVEKAKENGVEAILAGHTHEAQDYKERGIGVRILCAGSTTQDDPTNKHCQIIEVSRNSIHQPKVIVRPFEQDTASSSFRPKSTFI
jgi:3',5'-cyclic AMP phosphodiesterase CpdA